MLPEFQGKELRFPVLKAIKSSFELVTQLSCVVFNRRNFIMATNDRNTVACRGAGFAGSFYPRWATRSQH